MADQTVPADAMFDAAAELGRSIAAKRAADRQTARDARNARRHTQPRQPAPEETLMTSQTHQDGPVKALADAFARTFTADQLTQLDAESLDRPDMSCGPWQTIADAINRATAAKEPTR